MEDRTFNIGFEAEGKIYKGWVTPSEKTNDNLPVSYHVVLNGVFFGVLSNNGNWTVNEQRPKELTMAVGKAIEEYMNTSS